MIPPSVRKELVRIRVSCQEEGVRKALCDLARRSTVRALDVSCPTTKERLVRIRVSCQEVGIRKTVYYLTICVLKELWYRVQVGLRYMKQYGIIIPSRLVVRTIALWLIGPLHKVFFGFLCINAHLIRRGRKPRRHPSKGKPSVLHVTCSFDLGGTQRQLLNLCSNNGLGRFHHEAIEIFPEVNYLYRQQEVLDPERYVTGNFLTRMLGRFALRTSLRSLQVLQIYKLVRDFQAVRPEIVVGWGHEIAMLTFVAASIARVPRIAFCIRTFDPSHGWTTIGPLLEKAHKRMVPFLDGIVVNSTALQDDYSKWLSIPRRKIDVCPNGIDFNVLDPGGRASSRQRIRGAHGIPDDSLVIVNVGRFSEEKGQMLLVKAGRQLAERYLDRSICWLLCGDGPTHGDVEAYLNEHDLHNVFLVGRTNDIPSYLSAADIFVMPSDFEGMPNAMMEAMAYGLPCVSTNRTGALDVARDNQEALYVDVGSVEQLCEKISYLLEDPDERQRIGVNAQDRIKEFSIPNMIARFDKHLGKMLTRRNG